MDMPDLSNVSKLLRSSSPKAQFLGVAIATLIFLPAVLRILGEEGISPWKKAEEIAVAIGQVVFAVGLTASSPDFFQEGKDKQQKAEISQEDPTSL